MSERPLYVLINEALQQTRELGSATLQWAGVEINLTKVDDDPRTSPPEDSPKV